MEWNGMELIFCIAMAPRAVVIYPKERASFYLPLSFDLVGLCHEISKEEEWRARSKHACFELYDTILDTFKAGNTSVHVVRNHHRSFLPAGEVWNHPSIARVYRSVDICAIIHPFSRFWAGSRHLSSMKRSE